MSMLPAWKICWNCHKPYEWNPDTGRIKCPRCKGLAGWKKVAEILGRKNGSK